MNRAVNTRRSVYEIQRWRLLDAEILNAHGERHNLRGHDSRRLAVSVGEVR